MINLRLLLCALFNLYAQTVAVMRQHLSKSNSLFKCLSSLSGKVPNIIETFKKCLTFVVMWYKYRKFSCAKNTINEIRKIPYYENVQKKKTPTNNTMLCKNHLQIFS